MLSLAYAVWAFTARRGIFQDFANGRSVTLDDAKSSDVLDTGFLIVAGLVALIALGWWLSRMLANKTSGRALDKAGIALALLGVIAVVVGLFLANGVADAADRTAQGESGVTATAVVGAGFGLLVVGLLIGMFTASGQQNAADSSSPTGPATAYPGW